MADRRVKVVFEAQISNYKAAMKEAANSTKDLDEKIKSTGDSEEKASAKRGKALKSLAPAVTAAGIATLSGVAIATKAFADFDKQMSSVQAATHETAENMDLLRDAAIRTGADTAFSAGEAAQGIEEMAKAGVSTKDILDGGLDGALALAAAGNLGVAESAETAASAMTQFKLSGEDIPHIADLLAAGAGKAQGSVHDLGQALNQAGLVASATGLSVEETTGGLAAFASAGLVGSDAGTSFKSMLQRLTPQSEKAAKLMDELGLSAYDANGNFVGLSEYAGILQEGLKDMTVEQRNATMATLFGSDAVRAANVLYEQGSAGIEKWEGAVNDAGYAAETAAIMQDNLAGDLEKLGGAFDTVFIKSGGGANDILRGFVQTLESMVDTVGNIPPSILTTGTIIAGIAGGAAILGGGLITVLPKIKDTKDALDTLLPASERAGRGVRTAGRMISGVTAVGVGLLTAKAVIEGINEATRSGFPDVEQYVNLIKTADVGDLKSLLDLGPGKNPFADWQLDRVAGSMGEANLEAAAFKQGLEALVETKKPVSGWFFENLAFQSRQFVDDGKKIEDAAQGLAQAFAGDNASEAVEFFSGLSDEMNLTDEQLISMINTVPELKTALTNLASENGIPVTSDVDLLNIAMGRTKIAGSDAAEGANTLDTALAEVGVTTEGVVDDMKTFLDQLFAAGIATRDQRGSMRDYEEAIDAVAESIKENGRSLDITTEKGRANQAALDNIASSGQAVIESMAANGATQEQLQGKLTGTYNDLVSTAGQFGITGDKADALARKILGVPDGVSVKTWMSDQAKKTAEATKTAVDNIPTKKNISVTITRNIREQLAPLHNPEQFFKGGGKVAPKGQGWGVLRRASGGDLDAAPGPKGVDSQLFYGAKGEHVLTAREVDLMGGQRAVYRFRQELRSARGYASGGELGAARYAVPSSSLAMQAAVSSGRGGGVAIGDIKIYGATDANAVRRAVVDEISHKFQQQGVRFG